MDPEAQVVQPVNPEPPHWPHFATEQPASPPVPVPGAGVVVPEPYIKVDNLVVSSVMLRTEL